MKDSYEVQVLNSKLNAAVTFLKQMSEQETDKCKKLDIDYVITILTNKPYGSMPF
ncbi:MULTISPECIES: hypothetical protein [unclassified Bacillus cereus group]|uniref:hypothetical protein n=1 Tax=unclassified Bacillus cereus group TaxID=2750818 RepID=UPI001F59478F|nr:MULTISPECIES: hypothetical protein [unclassified Bacillus cereus group]